MDMSDNGLSSRKLWLVVFTQVLIMGSAILGCHWTTIAGMFPAISGALITCAGLYLGSNIAATHVIGKHLTEMEKVKGATEEEEVEEKIEINK